MSIFLSLRSKKGRRTSPVDEPSQVSTEPKQISDNSSSFGGMINQFPSPPTASPTETIQMTFGAFSRQPSTRRSSHGEARITDEDGLPFIPPSEIGTKFPTPTLGLSLTSPLIPHSQRNSRSSDMKIGSWSSEFRSALEHPALSNDNLVSHNDRSIKQNLISRSNGTRKSPDPVLGENLRGYHRRSRSATGLEELALARNHDHEPFSDAEPIQVSNTIGDIAESYSSDRTGGAPNHTQSGDNGNTEVDWSPRNSEQLMGGEHVLFYGKSPSFILEQTETSVTRSPRSSNRESRPSCHLHVVRGKLRVSSLPLQSHNHGRFILGRRRNSATAESSAGESNLALPSSNSETSDGKRQSKVLRTHPRYGDAYSSLTAENEIFSSSSTNLSNFQWASGNQRVAPPNRTARHKDNGIGQRLQSGGSDCDTSQGFSDYADIYEDISPSPSTPQDIHRDSSTSGPGHKRQGTPPLLFGTRAIGEPAQIPSPPPPTRSNSRLVRAAEAAGLQQSGRLMRAITDSSEQDWETVAGTTQGDHLGTVGLENASSYANNSTSDSDPKSRGLPTEPQPLPQPAHPRYVQTWILQKKMDKSKEVLIPSLESGLPYDAAYPRTPEDGHTYQHPAPLSKHSNPFSSSPILPDPANAKQTSIKIPISTDTGLLGAATTQADRSMSNYSLYDQQPVQELSTWVSTAGPMPVLPRHEGELSKDESDALATECLFTSGKVKLVKSASADDFAPNIKFIKSSSRDTGSSLADLSSSPTPATPSPVGVDVPSPPEIPRRTHKRRTFDGSLTSIAVEAEERNPMRKYMTTRESSYQSIDEPHLDASPAASRADIQAHERLLAKESISLDQQIKTLPQKPPPSSTPMQRLTSASSSAKEFLDAAATRGSALVLPVVTPRSSFHGSPQIRARAHGVTNSTAIELQPLSPPQTFRIQTRLKRRGTLLRSKRRKSSKSSPRPSPKWEDATRYRAVLSRPEHVLVEPPSPSKGRSRGVSNTTPHLDQAQQVHNEVDDRDVHFSQIPQMANLSMLPSGSGNFCTTEPTRVESHRHEQKYTLVPYMDDEFLASLHAQRRSVLHPKVQPSRFVRPTARKDSPHLHQVQHGYEDDLALQKRFSKLLIVTCLPLFPTLLMLGRPGSDKVVRMLSSGQASGFYKPYTIWTRSLAASLFSAGVAAIIVVACMGGFR